MYKISNSYSASNFKTYDFLNKKYSVKNICIKQSELLKLLNGEIVLTTASDYIDLFSHHFSEQIIERAHILALCFSLTDYIKDYTSKIISMYCIKLSCNYYNTEFDSKIFSVDSFVDLKDKQVKKILKLCKTIKYETEIIV